MAAAIYDYLEEHNLLSTAQFGFRSNYSVQDQLLLTYDYITEEYDRGNIVELILFDFSKAFDTVPHSVLIDKLFCLGFRNPLLGWLKDFLTGRTMRVVVSGTRSSSCTVHSGVPQGSVIGPLLFIIFVNHLITDLNSKYYLFADDLKIFLGMSMDSDSHQRGVQSLQSDIHLLKSRANSWGLSFAAHKCGRLRLVRSFANVPPPLLLTIDEQELRCSQSCRDLGLTVDTSLKFHIHVSQISAKASGISSNLLRGTICRTPNFMRELYISHIRPLIEFCSPVWNLGYIEDMKRLESIQRRWTKQVDGLLHVEYYHRLKSLNLYSVWGRLMRADLILVWKIVTGALPSLSNLLTPSLLVVTLTNS